MLPKDFGCLNAWGVVDGEIFVNVKSKLTLKLNIFKSVRVEDNFSFLFQDKK